MGTDLARPFENLGLKPLKVVPISVSSMAVEFENYEGVRQTLFLNLDCPRLARRLIRTLLLATRQKPQFFKVPRGGSVYWNGRTWRAPWWSTWARVWA